MSLAWKTGFEIELLAPAGGSRLDLAETVAERVGGSVGRFFHPQSEPSKVPGKPVFENLTLGFRVRDASGNPVASFVDDVTLQRGLDRQAPPRLNWYRIVSDDARILQLVMRHCDPKADLDTVLDPLADLFGTKVDSHEAGQMVKVCDAREVSVAIGAHLPGERERGCEIVTAPLSLDHAAALERLLAKARAARFTLPLEGATHIHFDATRLKNANAVANIAAVLSRHGPALKQLVGTNPNCVRLGPWPPAFVEIATSADFLDLSWPEAVLVLKECGLTKYCDFNLLNMLAEIPAKNTFEVRVLPAYLEAEPIVAAAELFEAVLTWCVETPASSATVPEDLAGLLDAISLDRGGATRWQRQLAMMRRG